MSEAQQAFIDRLRACENLDTECAHQEADTILWEALEAAGWSEVAAEYDRVRYDVGFWYA